MIDLNNITLARGAKTLIENSSANIHPKQRVGLIGKNGSGKSTLFSLFNQQIDLEAGSFYIPDDWTIANVKQETPALNQTAIDYVLDGHETFRKAQQAITDQQNQNDGIQLAQAHENFELIKGYEQPAKAAQLLTGLGFKIEDQQKNVADFSGGWRMRLNLAQALIAPAQLLLLDEPTNHLDLDAIIWLQDFLLTHDATQIIISHDKDFLDALCTQIIHLEHQKLTLYRGNYSQFEIQYSEKRNQEQALFNKQQTQKAHLQSYIDRFKAKASKAKQAQSRVKALEKLTLTAPVDQEKSFALSFPEAEHYPNPLIRLKNAELGYSDHRILTNINLMIENDARIGLLGRNGAGKSTLMKTLANQLSIQSGELEIHPYTNIGYFTQHQLEQLEGSQSPLWHIKQKFPNISEQEHRNFLGRYGFQGEKVDEQIQSFSGGEKARLALALIIAQAPNLLLLDEPTNHLDISMREQLTIALQNYQGAMVLVSHDRSLLRASCDYFFLIEDGRCDIFKGDLEDYRLHLKAINEPRLENHAKEEKKSKQDERRQAAQIRQQLQPLKNQLKQKEKRLNELEQSNQALEGQLSDAELYKEGQKEKLKTLLEEKASVEKALLQAEEAWINAAEALEEAEQTITNA